jgi:hypothetical protein
MKEKETHKNQIFQDVTTHIQGDHKVSVHLMITIQNTIQVMFKVSPASLQTFTDARRLTLTPSVIPNSNYVIMVSD